MSLKSSLKDFVTYKNKLFLISALIIIFIFGLLFFGEGITGAVIGIFASPTQGTPLINSTYGLNTTDENLTVYPQSVVCEGACKNITDWRLWNGSDNASIAVLNMPFEGGSSSDNQTNVADYSSYVNNGTNFHNVTYNATGGYDGKGAFEFDGVDDYVNVGNNASLNLTNAITVSVWVKPAFIPTWTVTGQIVDDICGQEGYSLLVTSNLVMFTIWNGTGYNIVQATAVIDKWQHFVGTFDGTTHKIYVDGLEKQSETYDAFVSCTDQSLTIGSDNNGGTTSPYNGTIDDALIFNRSLSADQIAAIYNNRTDLISSDETSIGDEWIACVTPNNDTGDGTTKCSENVTILAATNPLVFELVPANTSNYTTSQTIEIAANVTDDISVSSVTANVSIPNGTIKTITLSATGNKYNNSFNIQNVTGIYNVTFIALDNYNNLNQSEITTFNVNHTGPTVNIISPENYTWTTSLTPTFQFNFTDDIASQAVCEILVDGTVTATNSTTLNNTLTTLAAGALTLGTHDWTINCTDEEGGYNISAVNFTLDIVEAPTLTAPENNSLQGNPAVNSTSFTFNFTSNMIAGAGTNSASCELFITNSTGDIANGVNTTTPNGTETIILNNQSLTLGSPTWFINCTYNSTIITSDIYTLNVDSETPTINLVTPTNNSWTSETKAGNVSFTFNFTAGDTNQASCELFITNASGTEIANGVNTTTLNNTPTIIRNNNHLLSSLNPNGVKANWTVNCTFNGTTITAADYFSLNVDNQTPTKPALSLSSSTTSSLTIAVTTSTDVIACATTAEGSSISEVSAGSWQIVKGGLISNTAYSFSVTCNDQKNSPEFPGSLKRKSGLPSTKGKLLRCP
jgi:hypothetical protein